MEEDVCRSTENLSAVVNMEADQARSALALRLAVEAADPVATAGHCLRCTASRAQCGRSHRVRGAADGTDGHDGIRRGCCSTGPSDNAVRQQADGARLPRLSRAHIQRAVPVRTAGFSQARSHQTQPGTRLCEGGAEPTNTAQKTRTTATQRQEQTNSLTTENKSTKVTNSDEATC